MSGRLGPLGPSPIVVIHIPSAACSALNLGSKSSGDRSGAGWCTIGHLQGKGTHTP